MVLYFLKVTICWLVFYLVYAKFLSNETFFKTNRWYLLGTLLLGAGIPLLEFIPFFQEDNPVVVYFQPISEGSFYVQAAVDQVVTATFFDWEKFFLSLYLLGVAIFAIRFFIGLGKIYALYRKSEIIKKENHTLVLTDEPHLPFSFFRYMFWSKGLEMNDIDGQKIVMHEVAHVKGWHSIDVILLEVFSIIFWVSPMVYFYKKSLKTVHEYLADAVVLQTTPTKNYGHLLLRQSQSGLQIALANHFFHSQLKQRIVMMTRSKSRKEAIIKYLFAVPVILLLLVAFSRKEAMANTEKEESVIEISNDTDYNSNLIKEEFEVLFDQYRNLDWGATEKGSDIYTFMEIFNKEFDRLLKKYPKYNSEIRGIAQQAAYVREIPLVLHYESAILMEFFKDQEDKLGAKGMIDSYNKNNKRTVEGEVDEMPRFPGCEEIPDIEKRDKCAQHKLLTFIYSNIKYPAEARKAGTQGRVVVKFTVLADGTIAKAKIAKDIGKGCGEAALKVVQSLPKMIPGQKDGKAVAVEMAIPVSFKLQGDDAKSSKQKTTEDTSKDVTVIGFSPKNSSDKVYKVVDEMPRFKNDNCEKLTNQKELTSCSQKAMLEYLYSNVKYPKAAQQAGVEGKAIIEFVVKKDGQVADVTILRDPGSGTGAEAKRVVESMPNFVPGQKGGKVVSVRYVIPIAFKLAGPETNSMVKVNEDNIKIAGDMKPLFIIDGKEVDRKATEKLNPEAIASINVLKGEKALEKYGDKGKNGVVEITTKKQNQASGKLDVEMDQVKIKDLQLDYVKVSPNPSNGIIDIVYESEDQPMTISIFDMNGKRVYENKTAGGKGAIQNVDLGKEAKGIYFITFEQEGKIYKEKIVLQ